MISWENRYAVFGVGAILVLIIVAWLPVYVSRQYNSPPEEEKYIRRVYATHTVAQKFENYHTISAFAVALRGYDTYPGTLFVLDEQGLELGRAQFQLTPEDQWVHISLDPPVIGTQPVLTLTTDPSTPIDKAILIRYQPQSDIYPAGSMIVDGQESYGDIGFRLYDRVPAWRSVLIWGQITRHSLWPQTWRIITGVLIAIGLFIASRLLDNKRQHSRRVLIFALVALALAALVIHLPYLRTIEGVFGGDAFNYLSKASTMLARQDPFAADPRKGPLYSLLLVPGFFTADPLLWSRLISTAAAVAAVVLLPFIGHRLKLSWGAALGAGILLAVNQDFIWESPNALSNTLYVALILASILIYLKANTLRLQIWLAVLLGLTFLTRFEGILVAAVLLPALWWREKFSWQRALGVLVITIAIISLPQVSLLWSGQPGIRTIKDLQADEGLSLVYSWSGLATNTSEFTKFINSTWLVPEKGYTTQFISIALALGLIFSVGAAWLRARIGPSAAPYLAVVAILTLSMIILFTTFRSSESRVFLIALPWFFIGLGVAPFFRNRPFEAIVIFTLFAAQAAIITLILPKQRYFLPLLPLFSLWFIFGIDHLIRWSKAKSALFASLVVIGIFGGLLYADGYHSLLKRQEKYNVQAHGVNVMIKAVKYLRSQHGSIGFRTGPEPAIQTYIPASRRYFFGGSAIAELAWLREKNIKYIVERNDDLIWYSVRAYPDLFEHVHTFENIHGEERVLVYLVDRAKLKQHFSLSLGLL